MPSPEACRPNLQGPLGNSTSTQREIGHQDQERSRQCSLVLPSPESILLLISGEQGRDR